MGNSGKKVYVVVCNLVIFKNLFYSKVYFFFIEVYIIRRLFVVEVRV